MKALQHTTRSLHQEPARIRVRGIVSIMLLTLLALFVLSACSGTSFSNSLAGASTQANNTQSSSIAANNAVKTYPIKVFFSKSPNSTNNFAAVFPVDRISTTTAVATFSIQLLIAGPTLTERSAGYFSELNSMFTGPSVCSAPYPTGGPDFTITLDKKGKVSEKKTATLQFCRTITSPGIGADARVQAEITNTLLQFPTIKKVVILTKEGHCFGDESGLDRCLA